MSDYELRELTWELYHDLNRRVDVELYEVVRAIDMWIDTAFRRRLPADWREQLRWVLDNEAAEGRRVTPDAFDDLVRDLTRHAGMWGLLPDRPWMQHYHRWWLSQNVAIDGMHTAAPPPTMAQLPEFQTAAVQTVALPGRQTIEHAPDGSFTIHEVPNVSGPPRTDRGESRNGGGRHQTNKHRPKSESNSRNANQRRKTSMSGPKPRTKRVPKGEWISGQPGNGVRRLATPIVLDDGRKVLEVPFRNGMPVFDRWQLKGEEVFIALTGDAVEDAHEARLIWKAQNPGREFPDKFTFHHDGQVTELKTHKGKRVLVGRMQPIPSKLNKVPHIGSAHVARQLPVDKAAAREVNRLARNKKGPLVAVQKRLGKLLKSGAKRIIPIVGGILVIVEFSENAEAHGVGGAIIRAVPLLGDLVTVHDLGTALAQEIRQQAQRSIDEHAREMNRPIQESHEIAARMTAKAYREIAGRLRVTNRYFRPSDIEVPLKRFYGRVQQLISLEKLGSPLDYPAGTPREMKIRESVRQLRLRLYKERLERELREKVEDRGGAEIESGGVG